MAKAKSPFILGLASKSNRDPPRHFNKTAAFKLMNPSVKHSCSHRAEFGSPVYDGGVNSDISIKYFFFFFHPIFSLSHSRVYNIPRDDDDNDDRALLSLSLRRKTQKLGELSSFCGGGVFVLTKMFLECVRF